MRRALTVLGLFLSLFMAGSVLGLASAQAGSRSTPASVAPEAHHTGSHSYLSRRCDETFAGHAVVSGSPQGARVVWVTNSCGWQGRSHIKCWDQLTNQFKNENGGWVIQVEFADDAVCPSAPGWEIVKAGFEDRVGPGGAVANKWYYTRPGF